MAGRFECPGCHASLAYSAALAGRTVRCHHCQHSFEVPAISTDGVEKALPRKLTPPPLPVRKARAPVEELPVATLIPDTEEKDDDFVEEAEDSIDEPVAKRSPLKSAVFGLVAVYLSAFLVLASGITYIVWSESTRPVQKSIDPVAAPVETPVDYEQPKSLREVLNEGSKDDVPKVDQPGKNRPPRLQPPGVPRL
jgi:predicted Zn finger-like uncharacterized protein